jgi:hypothetical protein
MADLVRARVFVTIEEISNTIGPEGFVLEANLTVVVSI